MTEKLATKRNPPKWSLWLRGLDEWLLIFQKVSGAILAIYLIGHTLVISTALGFGHPSQLTWERVIGLIEGPRVVGVAHVGTIIEYLIALLVAVHGANGVRLILMQYFGQVHGLLRQLRGVCKEEEGRQRAYSREAPEGASSAGATAEEAPREDNRLLAHGEGLRRVQGLA